MKSESGFHYFVAGFNLGIIFELIRNFGVDLNHIIIETLKNKDIFEIINAESVHLFSLSPGKLFLIEREVTSYPISDPIIFKYQEKVIKNLLANSKYENTDIYKWGEIIWHEFWIIPTGTLLFIGVFKKGGDLKKQFDEQFILKNYNLLENIFRSVIQNLEFEGIKRLLNRKIGKTARIMSTSKMGIIAENAMEDYKSLLEDVYYIELLIEDEKECKNEDKVKM
jgi:hypothetical protein